MITAHQTPLEITSRFKATKAIFSRFNIDAKNTKEIYRSTALAEINPDFLTDVLNVFCNFSPIKNSAFKKYPTPILIDYLKRSHDYYLTKILPNIGTSIHVFLQGYHTSHSLSDILYKFYFNYKTDLKEHIKDEEELLFPYAKNLYNAVYNNSHLPLKSLLKEYSIVEFINNHDDVDAELATIIDVLFLHKPIQKNMTSYKMLIQKLKTFEFDLQLHAFIEDEVLVPKIIELENKLVY